MDPLFIPLADGDFLNLAYVARAEFGTVDPPKGDGQLHAQVKLGLGHGPVVYLHGAPAERLREALKALAVSK